MASAADGDAVSTFGVIPAAIRAEGEEWNAHVGGTPTPSGIAEKKDVGAERVEETLTPPWPDAGRVRISGNWAGSSRRAGLPWLLTIDVEANASELEEGTRSTMELRTRGEPADEDATWQGVVKAGGTPAA